MATVDFRIMGLRLHGSHGALAAERALGQHFLLDIELAAEVGNALTSDKVEDTVHYGHVIKAAAACFSARHYNLIEALAAAVADDLLAQFPQIQRVRITVHKPSAPVTAIVGDLSATVERQR